MHISHFHFVPKSRIGVIGSNESVLVLDYDACYVCIYVSASNDGECTFPCDPLDQLGNSGRFRNVIIMDSVRRLDSHVELCFVSVVLCDLQYQVYRIKITEYNSLRNVTENVGNIQILSGNAYEVHVCVVEYDIFHKVITPRAMWGGPHS